MKKNKRKPSLMVISGHNQNCLPGDLSIPEANLKTVKGPGFIPSCQHYTNAHMLRKRKERGWS